MKRTRILIALILFGYSPFLKAQDTHFSQFFETPLLRNPALAGIFSGDIRFQAVYRSQWNSITVPYQTVSLNGELKSGIGFKDDYITLGGEVLYDKAGTTALTATRVMPALNYHKSLSEEKNSYLSFGGMAGIVQRRVDRSKITTDSQFDGVNYNSGLSDGETNLVSSYSYFDGSVGMSFMSQLGESPDDNFFIGAAYHHFMKPKKVSFFNNPEVELMPKWVYSLGVRFGMSASNFFTLQADYATQGVNREIIGGALYSIKIDSDESPKYIFHAGGFLRWGDAIIPVAKLEFRPLSVSVSYDVNISPLKTASRGRGGFEFSLLYQKYRVNNSSIDAIRCPKF